MKKILYYTLTFFGGVLNDNQYTNLLFLFNNIRIGKKFYFLKINSPVTFNDKINFIKFNIQNKFSSEVADKVLVRNYVREKVGEKYLIPLIAVYNSADEINFKILPNQFVMKLNNGSGYNLICKNKLELNTKNEIIKFNKALKTEIYLLSREWHYKEIKPLILVEQLLAYNLKDYKFFCNQDGPFMVQIDVDRFTNHTRNIYNLNWELMPIQIRYKNTNQQIAKPKNFEKMIELATILSSDFIFCRIDLYEHDDKVYFGEITLHPGGGVEPFDSYNSDLTMGQYIKL